jgi:hypothetical protein
MQLEVFFMLTNVNLTSINCYKVNKPKFDKQRDIIFNYIASQQVPPTRREISNATGIELTSVAGRCNELLHSYDAIINAGTRKCSLSGITAHTLKVKPAQAVLFS